MKTSTEAKQDIVKKDVNDLITERFITAIEKGVSPFSIPWSSSYGMPRNFNGREYRGINFFLALIYCEERSWSIPVFMTYKQAKEQGWQVKKGEKSVKVSFSSVHVPKEFKSNPDDCPADRRRFYRKLYSVFNVSQVEGVDLDLFSPSNKDFEPIAEAASMVEDYKHSPPINHSGGRAFYSLTTDVVTVPPTKSFYTSTGYYEVLFHELAHSTGHPDRLGRVFGRKGSGEYAFEELVAELAASFLCARAGFLDATFDNSANYLGGWLEQFKSDKSYLIKAASKAQQATDFILGRSFG